MKLRILIKIRFAKRIPKHNMINGNEYLLNREIAHTAA